MYTQKMHPATTFPDVSVTLSTGESVSLTNKEEGCDWKVVVVYRDPLTVKANEGFVN